MLLKLLVPRGASFETQKPEMDEKQGEGKWKGRRENELNPC